MTDDRKTGTIIRILRDKAYGFIKVDGEKDLFFHANDLEGCTIDDLHDGNDSHEATLVSFRVGANKSGRAQAEDVRIAMN